MSKPKSETWWCVRSARGFLCPWSGALNRTDSFNRFCETDEPAKYQETINLPDGYKLVRIRVTEIKEKP